MSAADLARLDRSQLTARLEAFFSTADAGPGSVREVIDWLDGKDTRPLVPFVAPQVLVEELSFEDGVETAPQLVFALRHAVSKLSARLTGRRQATNRIDLEIVYDRTIFRLRTENIAAEHCVSLWVDLPAPLSHTDDLFRAIKAKIERLELAAPAVRIVLRLSRVVRAHEVQLDLSRDVSVSPDALPALLSELSAEIGVERVGVLSVVDDHRPERRTQLTGMSGASMRQSLSVTESLFNRLDPGEPTRLLPEPALLFHRGGGRLEPGAIVFVGRQAFVVKRVVFDRRLDGAMWWSSSPCSRDYLRVTLSHADGASSAASAPAADAWIYVDRASGETMLQGWWE
jgi:protein ImuB